MKMLNIDNNKLCSFCTEMASSNYNNFLEITDIFPMAVHQLNVSAIIFNDRGISIYANCNAEILYRGLGYEDLIGSYFDSLAFGRVRFNNILDYKHNEIEFVTIGGQILEIKYVLIKQKNDFLGVNMIIKDVTEIKAKEKELLLKSIAIQEIHHRIKNNLQTIASLLRLQSRRIQDINARRAMNESINRILSISTTHELLSDNGIDDVDIKIILERIVAIFKNYLLVPDKNIDIKVLGDTFIIDSHYATSIALVVNELIQNSIEHGFKRKKSGYINIKINKRDSLYTISVLDNGEGFDLSKLTNNSLGLNIVNGIVKEKLGGDFNIDSSHEGTNISFGFRL
ncbi:histidine kinase [Clostridium sp. Cult2]|nr:histidine kinase [Clostridium sp. Cult2]